jgi:hypothetical protein
VLQRSPHRDRRSRRRAVAWAIAVMLLGVVRPAQAQIGEFLLSVPGVNAPPESRRPLLAWTEAEVKAPHKLLGYLVEVATDAGFTQNRELFEVAADTMSFTFKTDLSPGTRYFWRVFALASSAPADTLATCVASRACTEARSRLDGAERSFTTVRGPFGRLEALGLTLQRARAGDRATEGAQFAFSRKLSEKKTPDEELATYTADFAVILDTKEIYRSSGGGLFVIPQFYVEGKLTSQENKAEDAWRFGGAAVLVSNFATRKDSSCGLIDGAYMTVGAKHESTQDFETKKFVTDFMITPTSRLLGMGVAVPSTNCGRGRPSNRLPAQITWRPYFELHYGRTIRHGSSAEVKETVLRLVPRIRVDAYLYAIRDRLNIQQVLFYVDNTYYQLPLEDVAKSHNLFVSGLEFLIVPNFGFGLTYKKGSSAPKFDYGNTFAGTLTVRFGTARKP